MCCSWAWFAPASASASSSTGRLTGMAAAPMWWYCGVSQKSSVFSVLLARALSSPHGRWRQAAPLLIKAPGLAGARLAGDATALETTASLPARLRRGYGEANFQLPTLPIFSPPRPRPVAVRRPASSIMASIARLSHPEADLHQSPSLTHPPLHHHR